MVELPARENPVKATRRRYYTPYEVAMHNTPSDCWVSYHGGVYDLTELIKEHQEALLEPLVKCAGTDISRWFTEDGNMKTHVCPVTNLTRPYCPQGRFVHVPPPEPVSNWATNFAVPWWQNAKLRIGYLSKRTRMVRIKNVLTEQEDVVEVPGEETLAEIRERYLELNWHAPSYTWESPCASGLCRMGSAAHVTIRTGHSEVMPVAQPSRRPVLKYP